MWRLKRWFPAAICLLLYLVNPLPARAECLLSFVPIEESKYLLKGEGCEGIASVHLTVDYDTTYLFAPDVVVMGGRLQEEDRGAATPPGNLQLHILNDDHSAAFEATLYFQKRGEYPPVINFVTAEVADLSGAQRPVPVEMVAPVNSPQGGEAPAVTTPEAAPAAPASDGGTGSALRESGATAEGLPPVPATDCEQAVPAEPERKAVFERFREFVGKKSHAAFTALFSGIDPCCRQIPPVLIADGSSTARVVISGMEGGDGAPLFTVSGGRLISVERGRDGEEWIVTVRPDEKQWDVRVRSAAANGSIDFPLIVAPAIDVPRRKLAKVDAKSFMPRLRSFLAGKPAKGKEKSPAWFREYLFTANYLAARGERRKR
ncbi:MAG: hypothetical protein NDI77_17545 [Geobacteraceae bacterium]|nr:hypothetical protein [Geobacteraceae bacterium]